MPEEDPQGPVDDGTLAVLHAMLTTFSDVLDGMDRRLSGMEASLRSLQADQEQAQAFRSALQQLARVEAIEGELARIRTTLADHPAATLQESVNHLTRQVTGLVAQPGPGPAMAMVAAGLAERFEQRTENIIELLEEHSDLMRSLTEQVEGAMQGLVAGVEGRQVGLDALLDSVRAVGSTIDGMGARLEDARDRFDSVFGAGEDLKMAVDALRSAEEAITATAQLIQGHDVGEVTSLVHQESELLAQRIAAVSVAVDAVQVLLAGHVEETTHSLGRKASEAGRRFVADLGLANRAKDRPARPAPPRSRGQGSGREDKS